MTADKVRIRHVEDMPVYQLFMELAAKVEMVTRDVRPEFRWLRIQMLRSSESACANMTEGFYAQYSTEYLQSLYRSRREARETMTHLEYAHRVSAITPPVAAELSQQYRQALDQLGGLIIAIERKMAERGKGRPLSYSVREGEPCFLDNECNIPFPIPHPPSANDEEPS